MNNSGLLTRTGTRLMALFAVVIATAGLMLASGSTPARAGVTTTYSFALANTSFPESGGVVSVNVIRGGTTTTVDDVQCAFGSSTATPAGVDFSFTPQTITFLVGETTKPCNLTITQDAIVDPGETVTLGFASPSSGFGGGGVAPQTIVITITDDDVGIIVTPTTLVTTEGGGPAQFTVRLNTLPTVNVTIGLSSGDATEGTVSPLILTFTPGNGTTPQPVTVTPVDDSATDGPITYTIFTALASGGEYNGIDASDVSVTNNDNESTGAGTIQFAQATYTVSEGVSGGNALVSVSRIGGSSGIATATCSSQASGSSAGTPADYGAVNQVLTWPSGDSVSKNCLVPIVVDGVAEPIETVLLNLSLPTGAALGSPVQATLFITDTSLPAITSLSPASGPIGGTNTITVNGANFQSASLVFFGPSASAAPFSIATDGSSLMVVVPSSSTGLAQTVEVVVRTPAGDSVTTTTVNDYTYLPGPTITSLSPASGPTIGGTTVFITGTGFTLGGSGMTVTFGGTGATFSVTSTTSITAVSPAHVAGSFNVVVTTGIVSSPNTTADDFTYTGSNIPTVTLVNPASGLTGITVTLTGTGFIGTTGVTVGGVAALFTVVSDTSLTVVIPASTPTGLVDIRVTNATGTSTNVTADDFTNTSTSGATTVYTLYFRWTLIAWDGIDNISASNAVKGIETPANAATNDVSGSVTAIWYFDGPSQSFKGYFVGFDNTPGANDFTTLRRGTSYWIAISTSGSVSWTVLKGS